MLGVHFITGDGRGNENIALTAVHSIFHSEHNRLAEYIDNLIHSGVLTTAEVAAWEAVPTSVGDWGYGERLFQAARFVTEMQYQHLVFEEFARTLVPSINLFQPGRHQLPERHEPGDHRRVRSPGVPPRPLDAQRDDRAYLGQWDTETITLFEGFLNPLEFNNKGNGTTSTPPSGRSDLPGWRPSAGDGDR